MGWQMIDAARQAPVLQRYPVTCELSGGTPEALTARRIS
jgi:hypothetical protein